MVQLRNILFRASSPPKKNLDHGVGLVLAPGPDDGLYVKYIVPDGPAWRANEAFSGPKNGKEGQIRVGDCLLDIQELHSNGNWGRKRDVFAKDLNKVVLPRLMGPKGSVVELSFRRIMANGTAVVVSVRVKRGTPATKQDVGMSRMGSHLSAASQNRFFELDMDGSGDISLEEVMQYLQKHPLPGQTSAWESAVMLFQRADRDQSGEIDVEEFEEAFDEFLARMSRAAEAKAHAAVLPVEDTFKESLEEIRDDLLDTIRQVTRPYMLRLLRQVPDPEDLYLIHSMYTLVGYNAADASSGLFELNLSMLDRNAEYFWQCFLRVLRALQRAQYRLGADTLLEEVTNEEEEDKAVDDLKKLIKIPELLSAQDIEDQRGQLPNIHNLVCRIPGRGIPLQQYAMFDPDEELYNRQREYPLPEPFLGQNEAVLHLISCLERHRLNTIIGEMGCGKTSVALAVVHTLQQRGKQTADGRYMYRDGVFFISCAEMKTLNQFVYAAGNCLCRLTSSLQEVVMRVRERNFLLVLDGVDNLLAGLGTGREGSDWQRQQFKAMLETLLEGVPGVSLLCTCLSPMGVPFENVVALNQLSDTDLAALVRQQGADEFSSAANVCRYMRGNPLAAVITSALLKEGVHANDLHDILSSHHKQDVKRLKLSELDPDPWVDAIKIHFSKDGVPAGNNLCMRAWIKCAVGYIQTSHAHAYGALRLLACFPAGLEYRDFVAVISGHHEVLERLFQDYRLLELVDSDGVPLKDMVTRKDYYHHRGGGGLLRVRKCVRAVVRELGDELPPDSRRMLRQMLNSVDKQASSIHQLLTENKTLESIAVLKTLETNLWACTNFDDMFRPDVVDEELVLVEQCGHVSLYLAFIMMALGRLIEANTAAVNCARFYAALFERELSLPDIRKRQLTEGLRVRAPGHLSKALRLAGEVKLALGAHSSAADDLAAALLLESPVKYPVVAFVYAGSRVGQADVLWSMSERELQKGNHGQAARLLEDCLRMYEEEGSTMGAGVAKHLSGQIKVMSGDLVGAFKDLNDAVHTYRNWNALARLADALVKRAEAALASTSLSRAREDLKEARMLCVLRHDVAGEAMTWKLEGEILVATGELEPATELLTFAREKAKDVNQTYLMAEATRILGEIASVRVVLGEHQPRYKVAVSLLKESLALYEREGHHLGVANARRALGQVLRKDQALAPL